MDKYEIINRIFDFEEQNYIDEAMQLFENIERAMPDDIDILLEKAKFEFRNNMDLRALLDFCKIYEMTHSDEIKDFLLLSYYQPNITELEERMEENRAVLSHYKYLYLSENMEGHEARPLWYDNNYCVWYDDNIDTFCIYHRKDCVYEFMSDDIIITNQCMWEEGLIEIEKASRQTDCFLDMKNPCYYVWNISGFKVMMQLMDVERILKCDRIVILVGDEAVKRYFQGIYAVFPNRVISYTKNEFGNMIQNIIDDATKMMRTAINNNADYYSKNKDNVENNIRNGKPRVLFWTTRFSTAVQYYTRDMAISLEKNGCECYVIIEENSFQRASIRGAVLMTEKFKPDIIVCMNHFRSEYGDLFPKELVFLTWIQDPIETVMDVHTVDKLISTDIVINQYYSWKKIIDLYAGINMIDASIPANPDIYKPYCLTEDEYDDYKADIILVCSMNGTDYHISSIVQSFPKDIQLIIKQIYIDYRNEAYETGKLIYGERRFRKYIKEKWHKYSGIDIPTKFLEFLTSDIIRYQHWVFRECLVHWILDAGFDNIKLWGYGWDKAERFRPYAMGFAQNGERLSKILQASKIVIGTNAICTATARVGESMLSGAFYMSNYLPKEEDWVDLRRQLTEGKEFIMYYDRDDLIDKLNYYLEHEDERKKMAEIGRKAALEKLTWDIFAKRLLEEVPRILEKQMG